MAKSVTVAARDDNFGSRMKSWPERVKTFYNNVRTEMRKVTAPSLKEVQATTLVVIITVFIFAGYFWLVDLAIGRGIDAVFHQLGHR